MNLPSKLVTMLKLYDTTSGNCILVSALRCITDEMSLCFNLLDPYSYSRDHARSFAGAILSMQVNVVPREWDCEQFIQY